MQVRDLRIREIVQKAVVVVFLGVCDWWEEGWQKDQADIVQWSVSDWF